MKKLIINQEQYNNLVSKICRDISLDDWRPDYVVGITRGGLLPAVMISHYFDVPCNTLNVSLRDSDRCESNLWMAEDAFGYVDRDDRINEFEYSNSTRRKNILVVDDINDSGSTFNWIMSDWESSCLPNDVATWEEVWNYNVRFAALVDNLSSQCRVGMYYIGMEINKAEKPVWVEFPYENFWAK